MTKNDEIPAKMIPSRKTIGKEYDKIPESMRPEESKELGYETEFEAVKQILKDSPYEETDLGSNGEAYHTGEGAFFIQTFGPINRVAYVEGVPEEDLEETAENLYNCDETSFEKIVEQGLVEDIDSSKIREML